MKGLAFLHTAASHVPRFAALAAELAPDVSVTHAVHADLLERARSARGVDAVVAEKLREVLGELAEGAVVVLCTCSTLGAAAEQMDGQVGARVVRIDRPLARAAVAQGERIAVIVALASTLSATQDLLEEEAQRAGRALTLETVFVPGAWTLFEQGNLEGYHRALVAAADEAAVKADIIVLAQASMAGAERWVGASIPALSSPRVGLEAALLLLRDEVCSSSTGAEPDRCGVPGATRC